MAPRGFNRYMIEVGAGHNRKFVRLTDPERCAHFLGILAIAAQSPKRGYLLIHEGEEATSAEVANEAGVTVKVAESAMSKLKRVGVLERHEDVDAWYVHDWHQINPDPGSSTERMRRHRDHGRDGSVTAERHASVTQASHGASHKASPEVEVEVEPSEQAQRNARKRTPNRLADQDAFPPSLPGELHHTAHLVLPILQAVHKDRGGFEPTMRGVGLALSAYPDRDHADVARSVQHWLTSGGGSQADCGDVVARFRRFLKTSPPATRPSTGSNVVPLQRSPALQRADAWLSAPEYQDDAS